MCGLATQTGFYILFRSMNHPGTKSDRKIVKGEEVVVGGGVRCRETFRGCSGGWYGGRTAPPGVFFRMNCSDGTDCKACQIELFERVE